MNWEFNDERPIYTQLVEQLQLAIVTGVYAPGGRLPGVRELATEAGVNPNTMQRALAELEGSGLLHTQRTAGRFVTDDASRIAAQRENLARGVVRAFLQRMHALGYTRGEALKILKTTEEEMQYGDDSELPQAEQGL